MVLRITARAMGKRLLTNGLGGVANKYRFLGATWPRGAQTKPPLGLDRGARPSRLCHPIGLQFPGERPMRRRRRRGSSVPFDNTLFTHGSLRYALKISLHVTRYELVG